MFIIITFFFGSEFVPAGSGSVPAIPASVQCLRNLAVKKKIHNNLKSVLKQAINAFLIVVGITVFTLTVRFINTLYPADRHKIIILA